MNLFERLVASSATTSKSEAVILGVRVKKINFSSGYVLQLHGGDLATKLEKVVTGSEDESAAMGAINGFLVELYTAVSKWHGKYADGQQPIIGKRTQGTYCPGLRIVEGDRAVCTAAVGWLASAAELTDCSYRGGLHWDRPEQPVQSAPSLD